MRVLVVGSGGREHALCWKLRQSPMLGELYCAPGNPGIAEEADLVPIAADEIQNLADFAVDLKIDLTVVGPEMPLTLGLVDEFEQRWLAAGGPGPQVLPRDLEALRQVGGGRVQLQADPRGAPIGFLEDADPSEVAFAHGVVA